MSSLMPSLFLGHGNPLNALSTNRYTDAWKAIGESLPKPSGILAVSAHWYVRGTGVTAMTSPRTIHDFGGFPPALYQVQYPAPGDPALSARIQELLAPLDVAADQTRGLDHGTWSVLCHLFPDADVPVVQLSIDEGQPTSFHWDLGRRLAELRADNILILGSGNLVHNLRAYSWGAGEAAPYDWAERFDRRVRELLSADEPRPLIEYERLGRDAALAIPTPDHYLPLLYTIGARQPQDTVTFPVDGIDGGSISMLAVQLG